MSESRKSQLIAIQIGTATGDSVSLVYVDQGYTREITAEAAAADELTLHVVKLPEATRGFVLLPRRWVVECSFAWATRCRRLVKDYERYATTLVGFSRHRIRRIHAQTSSRTHEAE
jgi:transposase